MAHTETITGLSLCSGIGMLDEGLRAGLDYLGFAYRVLGYGERDAYAAACLLARMEDESLERAPVFCGDIADLDARRPSQTQPRPRSRVDGGDGEHKERNVSELKKLLWKIEADAMVDFLGTGSNSKSADAEESEWRGLFVRADELLTQLRAERLLLAKAVLDVRLLFSTEAKELAKRIVEGGG